MVLLFLAFAKFEKKKLLKILKWVSMGNLKVQNIFKMVNHRAKLMKIWASG